MSSGAPLSAALDGLRAARGCKQSQLPLARATTVKNNGPCALVIVVREHFALNYPREYRAAINTAYDTLAYITHVWVPRERKTN